MDPADRERVLRMVSENPRLTLDQMARATAALDAWFDDGSVFFRPGRYEQRQLEEMHAALEAPDIEAALAAFPGSPGTWMTTPEQDAWNRGSMTELRRLFSRAPAVRVSAAGVRPAPRPAQATASDVPAPGVAGAAPPHGRRAAEPAEVAHGRRPGEETRAQPGVSYLAADGPASPGELGFPGRPPLPLLRKALLDSQRARARQRGLRGKLRFLRGR